MMLLVLCKEFYRGINLFKISLLSWVWMSFLKKIS